MIPPAHAIPPTQPSARQDALYPERGPSHSLYLPLGEWPRLPSTARMGREPFDSPTSPEGVGRLFFTARIERPPLYRGGSASKKNGLPAPSQSSEAARCASTGNVPATPPLFQHPAIGPAARPDLSANPDRAASWLRSGLPVQRCVRQEFRSHTTPSRARPSRAW